MIETTLAILRCPKCASDKALEVSEGHWVSVRYGDVERRELRDGLLRCPGCQSSFPVQGYVPSFLALLPEDVRSDASYWGDFYAQQANAGNRSFLEPELSRLNRSACAYDPEAFLLEHPLLRSRGRCLDVGCGTGWTTLHLARNGFDAIGLEPAEKSTALAKAYALEQGVAVDYICGAPGYVRLAPGSLDALFAFHSLHHVPSLAAVLRELSEYLRVGGVVAVDEHVQSKPELWEWREKLRQRLQPTVPPPITAAAPSRNEDRSLKEVVPALAHQFHVRDWRFRYVILDSAAEWAVEERSSGADVARLVRSLQQSLYDWHPGDAEYATILAQKEERPPSLEEVRALRERMPVALHRLLETPATGASPVQRGAGLLVRALQVAEKRGLQGVIAETGRYLRWRFGR